jgi:bla regulator protein blaR1
MTTPIRMHLLESTAFAILIAFLAFGMRKQTASARYAIWFAAVAKFGIPAALFSGLGIFLESWLPAHYSSLLQSANLPGGFYPGFSVRAISASPSHYWPMLMVTWLGSLVAMFSIWIYRSFEFGQGLTDASAAEYRVLERMRQHLRIRRGVRLEYSTPGRYEFGLWGIRHPTIRIPKGLSSQLTPVEFEAVLAHELAHVRRWDNLSGVFIHAMVCVFWFHPFLWWMERRLAVERERACDEMVIHDGAQPEAYIAGILKVCRFQLSDAVAGTSGITRSDLKNRMERIMSYRLLSPASRMPRFLLGSLGAMMTIVPFVNGFLQQSVLHAQTKESACLFDGVAYAQGAVLQMGSSPQSATRECSGGHWIPTSKAATAVFKDKSRPQPQSVCETQPSTSPNACRCQDGDYSLGAMRRSANGGVLRCDKFELGKFTTWRLATPRELEAK